MVWFHIFLHHLSIHSCFWTSNRCSSADKKPPAETHHSDSVSDGLCGQVASKLCSNHAAVAMSPGHLSPDHSGLVGFTAWRHCVPGMTRHTWSELGSPHWRNKIRHRWSKKYVALFCSIFFYYFLFNTVISNLLTNIACSSLVKL